MSSACLRSQTMAGDKVTLFCHFGGNIVREAGEVFYDGGMLRVAHVNHTISYADLMSKMIGMWKLEPNSIHLKYQYPGKSLSSLPLVSIQDEYDVRMMVDSLTDNLSDISLFIFEDETSKVTMTTSSGNTNTPCVENQRVVDRGFISNTPRDYDERGRGLSKEFDSKGHGLRKEFERRDCGFNRNEPFSISARGQTSDIDQVLVERDRRERLVGIEGCPSTSLELGWTECTLVAIPEPIDRSNLQNIEQVVTVWDDNSSMSDLVPDLEPVDASSFQNAEHMLSGCGDSSGTLDGVGRVDCSLELGQEFPNVKVFRNALKSLILSTGFEVYFSNNSSTRVSAHCKGLDKELKRCTWRIHASNLQDVSTFKIKTFNSKHSCNGLPNRNSRYASMGWIAFYIIEQLRHNLDYKPKHIIEDIQRNFGIKISYKKAWRGREEALKLIRSSSEDSSNSLPSLKR